MTQTQTAAPPEPVDWELAERVARRFAGREPIAASYLGGSLDSDFSAVTTQAEQLVGDFTGLHAPGTASACVLDRAQWVHANVGSMRRMLHPLTARVAERVARSPVAPIGRRVAGTEMGVLLGFMAQRVLGQYDLLVPDDPDQSAASNANGAVYYVGANILALEKRYAFRPRDFRLWIAIHEVTHRAQFTAVPWLKGYFLSLVEQALAIVDPDPGRLVQAMMRAADELRKGRNPLDDGGLVALVASSEQRGVLAQVQALMSLLEGHGNSVMNELGRAHIAGQERMARVLQARRRSRGVAGILYKLLGFESKLRQYEVGEAFVAEVVRVGGPRAIDAAWRGPESLPTMDELARPTEWLARVA
ncbi:MAG TPA: zinc-dependent metalloprotease [Acidimicrobiia bacterium]|nr:zinc-dependent metalloprotease [Acidimicrobiia bacterium]